MPLSNLPPAKDYQCANKALGAEASPVATAIQSDKRIDYYVFGDFATGRHVYRGGLLEGGSPFVFSANQMTK